MGLPAHLFYGLSFRFQLLSTPRHRNAVTFNSWREAPPQRDFHPPMHAHSQAHWGGAASPPKYSALIPSPMTSAVFWIASVREQPAMAQHYASILSSDPTKCSQNQMRSRLNSVGRAPSLIAKEFPMLTWTALDVGGPCVEAFGINI